MFLIIGFFCIFFQITEHLAGTFGCLFMVSALIVTAIPVQPIAAAGGWSPTDILSPYPFVLSVLHFPMTLPNIAQGLSETIPLPLQSAAPVFVKYTDSGSATGSYAAANKKGYPLYYKSTKTVTRQVEGDMVLTSEDLNGTSPLVPARTQLVSVFSSFPKASGVGIPSLAL